MVRYKINIPNPEFLVEKNSIHNRSKHQKIPKRNPDADNSSMGDPYISCCSSSWVVWVVLLLGRDFPPILCPHLCAWGATCPSLLPPGVQLLPQAGMPFVPTGPTQWCPVLCPHGDGLCCSSQMSTSSPLHGLCISFPPLTAFSCMTVSHLLQWLTNLAAHLCHVGALNEHVGIYDPPPRTLSW